MVTMMSAEEALHRALAEAHATYADAIAKGAPAPTTTAVVGDSKMSQTMAWYARHGSVLKQVSESGGTVPVAKFNAWAKDAGYTRGSRGQLTRKNGLLKKDEALDTVTLTARGVQRLAFAEKYLADRGIAL